MFVGSKTGGKAVAIACTQIEATKLNGTLGRATLPNMAATVSARHLEVTPIGHQLYLRHCGSNPTLIEQQGKWYQFADHWIDSAGLGQLRMRLAETEIVMEIR